MCDKMRIILLNICLLISLMPAVGTAENEYVSLLTILPEPMILTSDGYICRLTLAGFTDRSGSIVVEHCDGGGALLESRRYTAASEVEIAFADAEPSDYATIRWLDGQGVDLCEATVVRFNVTYALDWQALARITAKMVRDFAERVAQDADSTAFASGRLIVSLRGALPDVSAYQPVLTVFDDDHYCYIQFLSAANAKSCAEYLSTSRDVAYAEPDGIVYSDTPVKE